MKVKIAFVLGAGLGYLVGTPSGRAHLDQVKSRVLDVWNDPRVQEHVQDVQLQATAFAKAQGATLKDKVSEATGSLRDRAPSDG